MNILKLKKALSDKHPFNAMYKLIPDKKKGEFLEFAKAFGLDEKKLKEILEMEERDDCKEKN